jgi:hypothetical protein
MSRPNISTAINMATTSMDRSWPVWNQETVQKARPGVQML